jgi:hypothetical protein
MAAVKVPFAEWRPLPEATSQPRIDPTTVIFHTAVGTLRGVERYFRDSTGVESHMMVGGPEDGADLDGVTWQWMDLERQADANLDANRFAISIETSDNHPQRPEDIVPWSPKQLAALVRLGNWCADRFDIPRRQCPAWNAGGFGWHAMWGAPSHWTPSSGKVCPGPARIAQLKTIVLPAIFAGRELNDVEEDAMTEDDRKFLATEFERLAQFVTTKHNTGYNPTAKPWVADAVTLDKLRDDLVVQGTTGLADTVEDFATRQRQILAKLNDVLEAVTAPPADPPPAP